MRSTIIGCLVFLNLALFITLLLHFNFLPHKLHMLVFASAELATIISPLVWLALIFSRISHSYNDEYFFMISIGLSVIVYGGIHGYLIRLKPLTVNQLMVNLSLRFLLTWAVSIAVGYAVISFVEFHDS